MFRAYYLIEVVANICSIIVFIIVVGYVFYTGIRWLRIEAIRRKANKLWKELKNNDAEQMADRKNNTHEG